MDTIHWHIGVAQGGANLYPDVNLHPRANLHPGANCAYEHGLRKIDLTPKKIKCPLYLTLPWFAAFKMKNWIYFFFSGKIVKM